MNIALLFNCKPVIEEALRGFLTLQGWDCFTRQNAPETFQTTRPRVEVVCKIGDATGHRSVQGGVLYNDVWHFSLALRVVTEPQNQEQNNLGYDTFVADVRGAMQTFGQSTWSDYVNFPYHLIVEPLRDTTTDDSLISDNNEEFAILTFGGMVQIRTNAWNNT